MEWALPVLISLNTLIPEKSWLQDFVDKTQRCKRGAKIIRNFDPAKRNIAFLCKSYFSIRHPAIYMLQNIYSLEYTLKTEVLVTIIWTERQNVLYLRRKDQPTINDVAIQ